MAKILVIDDKQDNLTSICAVLAHSIPGSFLITALSGAEGIEKAKSEKPDTILLDVKMPGMDGYEVCRRLKANPGTQAIPIIMITAIMGDTASQVLGFETGADAYLRKPVDPPLLTAQVKIALRIKKAEDQLKKENLRLSKKAAQTQRMVSNLMANLPGMAFRCRNDEHWTMEFVSQGCFELTGYLPEELVLNRRLSYNDLIHPQDRTMVWETVQELLFKKKPYELFYRIITADGKEKWIWEKAVGCFSETGDLEFIEGFISDITQQKQLEAQRRELEKRLVQAQKMESIGNLAGGIAHDFNNILASVLGYTELALQEVEKDTTLEEELLGIYSGGKRARDLVRQILTFARQSDEAHHPLRIDLIAKEALKFLRSTIPSSIEICHLAQTTSLILGNPTQVHQVFMNLCTNAAQAMGEKGGIIEVHLKDVTGATGIPDLEPGDYVELRVADTGVGIPQEIMNAIFEPYFTTKSIGEGTGMGLALVHGIVESCKGKILVESCLGKGSVFTLYFPITQESRPPVALEPEKPALGTETILLVDDDPAIAMVAGKILEHLGYKVTTCTSSLDALDLFQSNHGIFDLVITDMTMPDMTGEQLAAELIRIRPDIPIILLTGYSPKISDQTMTEAGIRAFAQKPVVMADLAKVVRSVLDGA